MHFIYTAEIILRTGTVVYESLFVPQGQEIIKKLEADLKVWKEVADVSRPHVTEKAFVVHALYHSR